MQIHITQKLHIDTEILSVVYHQNNSPKKVIRMTQAELNVLLFLTSKIGEIISKDELIAKGWQGRNTGNNSLNVAIFNIRKSLSLDEDIQLENIPRIGYKLNIKINTNNKMDDKANEDIITAISYASNKKILFGKLALLAFINVCMLQLILTTYLNLVWVQCDEEGDDKICYSQNYIMPNQEIEIPKGFSVISNHQFSNKSE